VTSGLVLTALGTIVVHHTEVVSAAIVEPALVKGRRPTIATVLRTRTRTRTRTPSCARSGRASAALPGVSRSHSVLVITRPALQLLSPSIGIEGNGIGRRAFYLYDIINDWPNHQVTKKLFRTAVPNFIFDYTRVPFRPFWSLTSVNWPDNRLQCPWTTWSREQKFFVPSATDEDALCQREFFASGVTCPPWSCGRGCTRCLEIGKGWSHL